MQLFLNIVCALALWLTRAAWLMLCGPACFCLFRILASPLDRAGPPAGTVLRAAVPAHTVSTGCVAPFGPGFEEELLQKFSAEHGYALRLVPVPSAGEGTRLLRLGRVDVVAGFALAGEAGMDIGPPYFHARSMMLAAAGVSPPEEGAALPPEAASGPDGEMWRMDARSWAVWAPFIARFEDLQRQAEREESHESYHWGWRAGERLAARLESFWRHVTRPGEGTLAALEDRYFSYLADRASDNVVFLLNVVQKRLPRYSGMIAGAAARAGIDPLLLTALIMQESQLDEGCVSHTGVRGIMQLTRETAAFLGVDRMNPAQAIEGGARYLRMLWDDLEDAGLDDWDRWFCALAAFNQGPQRLKGAMRLARRMGGTGLRWSELKTVYPLLSRPHYAALVGQGTCRGLEAVIFVNRVRWNYHVLRGLVALARPEAQYLAPLLRGRR